MRGRVLVLYQRRESGRSEQYEPVGCWLQSEPTSAEISGLVPSQVDDVASGAEAASGAGGVGAPARPQVEKMPWD